jgi:negative regulator of sigma E activity
LNARLCFKVHILRRGGRVVEGARLESVYTGNRIAGSNPALSASSKNNFIKSII